MIVAPSVVAELVADLEQMDAACAIDLDLWPAARALVDGFRAGGS